MALTRGIRAVRHLLFVALAGCAATGRDSPPAVEEEPIPAGFVEVDAIFPDGSRAEGAVVGLEYLSYTGRYATVVKETVSGVGNLRFRLPCGGRYRVSVLQSPGVFEGWLHMGDLRSDRVEFEAAVEEAEGRRLRLTVPRPGGLAVTVEENPEEKTHGGVSLNRLWADGSLRPYHAQAEPVVRREGGRRTTTWGGLPEGRWLARTWGDGRRSSSAWCRVEAGRTTPVEIPPGQDVPALEVRYEGPFPPKRDERDARGLSFNLNPLLAGNRDLTFGTIPREGRQTSTWGVGPGRYLFILWDLDLAMSVVVPEDGLRILEATVPPGLPPSGAGGPTVRVSLVRHGERNRDLWVALAPLGPDPTGHGSWMRFCSRPLLTYDFPSVPRGEHLVLVFDHGRGGILGLDPSPVVRRIIVGKEDVLVTVDLDDMLR